MTVNINNNLDLNITDFLLLQEISEMKLNRSLNEDNTIRFYDDYKNSSISPDLIKEFYATVGAIQYKNPINGEIEYIGGAGAYTKISQTQADYFLKNFEIIDYYGNDNTGFSATTFKDKRTHEITISFRSTEFTEDYYKDAVSADNEINDYGTAIGQNISLVNYLKKLQQPDSKGYSIIDKNAPLNITGYSLGGHLASSAYQYLTADGYNINKLYVFNGPGVGNVKNPVNTNSNTTTENFGYLEKDLLSYTSILNTFNILKSQNIINADDAVLFVNQNSTNQFVKDFFNNPNVFSFLPTLLFNNLTTNSLNNSTLNIYDSQSATFDQHETEVSKSENTANNANNSYFDNTIYHSSLYNVFKSYIVQKYNMSKAGLGGSSSNNQASMSDALVQASQSEKTGIEDLFLFGHNTMWINGKSSVNNYDYMSNDFNFVSNSNRYGYNTDIIIEDRPEFENGVTRLPVADSLTKTLTGDFGNTHSITLLNKSLNLMATLAKLEGKTTIDVAKYSALISSSSKERAAHFYNDSDGVNGTGDYNAIANILNTLTAVLLPNTPQLMFDNTLRGWADINKINTLDAIEVKLKELISPNLNIVSFYDLKSDDMSRKNFNTSQYHYISKQDLITQSKTNIAYRYALDKLNTFVIEGADYSSYKDTIHSEQWYSSRADILLKIIDSNVQNSINYMTTDIALEEDNSAKSSNISNNIYVNDNKQDILFINSHKNPYVGYPIYNIYSYYSQSRVVSDFTSFDVSLTSSLKKIWKNFSLMSAVPNISLNNTNISFNNSYSSQLTNVGKNLIKLSASTASAVGVFAISFGITYTVVKSDNIGTIGNFNPYNPDLIKQSNYLVNTYLSTNINTYIGNYTSRNSLSINKNIYFLDNLTFDYTTNNTFNKSEDVFINVNKDEYWKQVKESQLIKNNPAINSINDLYLMHYITLGDGNDYIEILDDIDANIKSTSGTKNYYLNNKESMIFDPDKTGTITLDGILLTGGDMYIEDNGTFDPTKRVQVYYSKDQDNNSVSHRIIYNIDSPGYSITNEKTGHKILIPDLNNFGSGYAFNFKNIDTHTFNEINTISNNTFYNDNKYTADTHYIHKIINSNYSSETDFSKLFNIDINIDNKNMVISKDALNNKNLFIYDKNNPSNMYTIADFFDENGDIRYYNYNIYNMDGYVSSGISSFNINNTDVDSLSKINPSSNGIWLGGMLPEHNKINFYSYYIYPGITRIIYYSPISNYYLDNSIVSSTGFKKDGDNLILYSLSFPNSGTTTIKNYFSFDHSDNTNFYINRYGENIKLNINDILKRIGVKVDDNSSHYIMDSNSYHTVVSGLGNDTIIGTTSNETFISEGLVKYIANSNNTYTVGVGDGNDTFTGNGGSDTYSFDVLFGHDTITDFNNSSIIYIDNSYEFKNYQFLRDNDDLIVYTEFEQLMSHHGYNQLVIKNYFNNIDYTNDSRIIFTKKLNNLFDFNNNPNYHYQPENTYHFNTSDIELFNTTDLNKSDDEVLEQTAKDTTHANIDINKLSSSYISGNDLDNTIIIKNNDTVIHSNQTTSLTDGNDTYIIDILPTEAIPLTPNNYRTTIEFGFNSGHDILLNPLFKNTHQYGDIIDLKNIDSESFAVNSIKDDKNVVIGLNLILQDGSSMLINLPTGLSSTAEVIKTSDYTFSLGELLTMATSRVITGDSMNNSLDLSDSIKSVSINGLEGNDYLIGGNTDDIIEGGKGFDKFKFSKGLDTYIFNLNSDIDNIDMKNITSNEIINISAKFLVNLNYKENNISYSYNASENEGYFQLSGSDGLVFSNISWSNFVLLINNITVEFNNGEKAEMDIHYTNDFPFINNVKIVNGTDSTDYLQTNSVYSNFIYGKDGNDTIVSTGGTNSITNYLIGGKGNDIITANDGDLVIFKDGDGTDIIKTTDRSFVLEFLHNTPRIVNQQQTLFDVSAVQGTNDLKLKYGTTDTVTIKDYFSSGDNEITIALYDKINDTTFIYNSLDDILSSLHINKSSLLNTGSVTVYKDNTDEDLISSLGQLVGGEISYQYLHGNEIQNQNTINHIFNNQLNKQPLQNKLYF